DSVIHSGVSLTYSARISHARAASRTALHMRIRSAAFGCAAFRLVECRVLTVPPRLRSVVSRVLRYRPRLLRARFKQRLPAFTFRECAVPSRTTNLVFGPSLPFRPPSVGPPVGLPVVPAVGFPPASGR